jgi:hypothetical protein
VVCYIVLSYVVYDLSVGTCPLEDPCLSLYTLEEEGYKQNSLFVTITISSTACNLVMYALILWGGPPQTVRPMYHLVVPGVYTPTASPRAPYILIRHAVLTFSEQ